MTTEQAKDLVRFMRDSGVMAFELDGLKVQFSPRAVQAPQTKEPTGAEATQPATPSSPAPERFQGMDLPTLLGVSNAAGS